MHTNRANDRKNNLANILWIKNMIVQTNKNLSRRFRSRKRQMKDVL